MVYLCLTLNPDVTLKELGLPRVETVVVHPQLEGRKEGGREEAGHPNFDLACTGVQEHTFLSATLTLCQEAPGRHRGPPSSSHQHHSTCPASSRFLPQVTCSASLASWLQVEDSLVQADHLASGAALCHLLAVSVVCICSFPSLVSVILGRPVRATHHGEYGGRGGRRRAGFITKPSHHSPSSFRWSSRPNL